MKRSVVIAGAAAIVLALAGTPAQAADGAGTVLKTATLPDIPLGQFSNALLSGTVTDDRGVDLGGIGSDLYPTGVRGEFWTVTDRGPNGQIKVDDKNRRTFPVPGFDPAIVKIKVSGSTITILKAIPIVNRHGEGVTGLPNQKTHDETPYDYAAKTELAFNPEGLDTEGIVRAKDGSFWLADEYGPSLVHVSSRGKVLARYVPEGLGLKGTDYPVIEAFPAIFAKRKINRGFEGLGLLPGGDLVIVLQSPLSNPDAAAGNASGTTRLVRFSTAKKKVTAEYAYGFDAVGTIDPGEDDPTELKSSAVIGIDDHTVLVEERTDKAARVYRVDLRKATNILGSKWDDVATKPSLEVASGVPVPPKKLVINLGATPGVPKKIEGIALVDRNTIAIINDNDFGMTDGAAAFDANGNLVDSGIQTQLQYVRLP